jgi:hypothetical protein
VTTGNEPAQPQPDNQPGPAALVAPAPAAPEPAPAPTDPDELELLEAREAAKTEEAATPATPAVEGAAGTAPAATPEAPAGTPPPPKPAAVRIPKARLDEALGERDKALQDAAYWRGRAEASAPAAPGQPGQPQPAAALTPEQSIAAIRAEKITLAKQFDAGEISMEAYEAKRDALDDKVATIREDALVSKVKPAASNTGGDALYLDTATAELERAHPWTQVFQAVGTESDWKYLEGQARERLAERGVELKGTIGSYHLREEMAKLADEFGPALVGARATAKGIALPGQTAEPQLQPGTPQPKALSPQAKALTAKLALHASAPPSVPAMSGGTSGTPGVMTDSQIEMMSEDDYDKLPAAVRNRMKGISA